MKSFRLFPALFLVSLLGLVPAFAAVNRSLTLTAPAAIKAGMDINAVVTAATEAEDAEQIAFLQTEFSVDGGKTWVPVYAENLGRKATRTVNIPAGQAGSQVAVRARVAFRGGKAGDVDFTGAPIQWEDSWGKWASPPAKTITVNVTAR
jgi:hypothetical protein